MENLNSKAILSPLYSERGVQVRDWYLDKELAK